MLVGIGVDQLDVHSDAIAGTTDTALENRRNTKSLSDVANIWRVTTITHDRCARDHFQITNLRQVREDVVLHAIREVRVLLLIAQVFKWQHRNRLIDLVGGRARQNKKAGRHGKSKAAARE